MVMFDCPALLFLHLVVCVRTGKLKRESRIVSGPGRLGHFLGVESGRCAYAALLGKGWDSF